MKEVPNIGVAILRRIVPPSKLMDCWIWKGAPASNGYGRITLGGVGFYAHRVSYRAVRGPLPAGLVADHICRVRNCVNPWHIRFVTVKENNLCGFAPHAINARKTHCKHGHSLHDALVGRSGKRKDMRTCRVCSRLKWMNSKARARRLTASKRTRVPLYKIVRGKR